MYFLALADQFGYECVIQGAYKTVREWDIIQDSKNTYLCLWQDMSFPQLYDTLPLQEFVEGTIISRSFFSPHTMQIIHRMVDTYFSSYKAVVQLYLSSNAHTILTKEPKKKTADKHKQDISCKQHCTLYPDIWSMTQDLVRQTGKSIEMLQKTPDIAIFHGWLTQGQKANLFRSIKQGGIKHLFATNRWLFFDWYDLASLTIYNSTSRAYSSQSEPRFVIQEVANYMSNIYNAKKEEIFL